MPTTGQFPVAISLSLLDDNNSVALNDENGNGNSTIEYRQSSNQLPMATIVSEEQEPAGIDLKLKY